MITDESPRDWSRIDGWYDSLSEDAPAVGFDIYLVLTKELIATNWSEYDRWWDSDKSPQLFETETDPDAWEDLETWWNSYIASQEEAISSVQSVFAQIQQQWETSSSRFETGPLLVDWRTNDPMEGPLWTRQEENWSQWLAHLIRTAPGEFSEGLFGEGYSEQPQSVERERLLTHNQMTNRFPDILVHYPERGVSIEVKKGDEAYEKTLDTAELIEYHYPKVWTHILLVPSRKKAALRDTFEEPFEDSQHTRPIIRTDRSNDIQVVFWEDISRLLRQVLQDVSGIDPHWEASAYVFATLIEEKIAKFVPLPVIDQAARTGDVVRLTTEVLLSGSDIEEQLTYLRTTLGDDINE